MPRDSNGTYVRPDNSFSEPVIGEIIDPVAADELFDDQDEALTDSLSRSGLGGMTADLDLGGFELLNGTTGSTFVVDLDVAGITGTLPAASMPALTGDVTSTVGSVATSIAANAVTNTMLSGGIAASKLVGTDIATVGTITAGVWNGTAIAAANLVGSDITVVGTIATGTWSGTTIALNKGGTGSTDAASARTALGLGSIATQAANSVAITGGTITGMPSPTLNSDVATKAYADSIASGISPRAAVKWATAAVLPNTPTYANGASGVGATLTAGGNAAIAVDGGAPVLTDRVLVKNQVTTLQNGVYTVTTVGDGSTPWVLTRATDFDAAAEMTAGAAFTVTAGSANIGTGWSLAATVTTVGTDPATFNQYQSIAGALLVASNLSDINNASTARTNLGLAIGTNVQAFDSDLSALAANSTTGFWARTGAGTGSALTLTGTANEITVTNGAGGGTPVWSLPTAITGTGKTWTGGTFTGASYSGTIGQFTTRTILAADATTFSAGGVTTPNYGFTVDSNSVYAAAFVDWNFYTNQAKRFTILQNGNVGVGTSAPAAKFAVSNAGTQGIEFDPTTGTIEFINRVGPAAIDGTLYTGGNTNLKFTTNTVERMRITGAGNVGIGTASPAAQLHNTGTIRFASMTGGGGGGFLAVDGSGNVSVSSGSGTGVGATGGTLGQILIKQSAVNGQTAYYTPGEFNITSALSASQISGAAQCDTEFDAAFTNNNTVIVPPGCTLKLSGGHTIARGKTLVVAAGGYLNPDLGVTITVHGVVNAGVYKIFGTSAAGYDIAGTVTGISQVYPEWWGAARDGTVNPGTCTDDSSALNAANLCVQGSTASDGVEKRVIYSIGIYSIGATVTFTSSAAINWRVEGGGTGGRLYSNGGTVFLARATFTGSAAINFLTTAGDDLDFYIHDFKIINTTKGSGPSIGFLIGGTTSSYSRASKQNKIEALIVSGFLKNIQFQNIVDLTWHRVKTWPQDSANVEVTDTATSSWFGTAVASGTVGDMDFYNCEAVGCNDNGANVIGKGFGLNDGGNAGATITGIRFHGCRWFGAEHQLDIAMSNASTCSDVWVNPGCQFEGPPGVTATMVYVRLTNSSIMFDFHVDHIYGSGNGFNKHFDMIVASTSALSNVFLTNNFLPNAKHEFIDIRKTSGTARGVTITGNQLKDPFIAGVANAAIYLEDITQATVNGNTMTGTADGVTTSQRANLIQFNVSATFQTAVGNNSGGLISSTIVSASGGASSNIANNV